MLERTETRFGMKPASLAADSAYGSADSLAWLVKRRRSLRTFRSSTNQIEPTAHFPGSISNSTPERDCYACPAGKELVQFRRTYATPGAA